MDKQVTLTEMFLPHAESAESAEAASKGVLAAPPGRYLCLTRNTQKARNLLILTQMFWPHAEFAKYAEARIVTLACVGFAECFRPDGSKSAATCLREICEICVRIKDLREENRAISKIS